MFMNHVTDVPDKIHQKVTSIKCLLLEGSVVYVIDFLVVPGLFQYDTQADGAGEYKLHLKQI